VLVGENMRFMHTSITFYNPSEEVAS